MKKKKNKEQIKIFKDQNYLTCGYCGYNNARQRLEYFKRCLNCGKPLGDKKVFKRELRKRLEKEKNGLSKNKKYER